MTCNVVKPNDSYIIEPKVVMPLSKSVGGCSSGKKQRGLPTHLGLRLRMRCSWRSITEGL